MSKSAFPVGDQTTTEPEYGMSLRDYFAAAALQGMCARTVGVTVDTDARSKLAYEYADSMLAARDA